MAEVTLSEVYKLYAGGVPAVKGINLDIRDGEFLVLVGPSGCGKSTTLRMVAGLEEISGGTIRIGSRVVNDVPPKDRDIAMVFQNYALYPHMTVYDNMGFGLKLRKAPAAEIDRRVRAASAVLGLDPYLERRPSYLSGGQRQRVAMGRAIVREPAVYLFDEPLSNLDAKMRVEMRREILHLHRRVKATMIYVTHDQIEAMTLGDRIVVMRDGRIEQAAEPDIVFNMPASVFVAKFIGTPPMNISEGVLRSSPAGIGFDAGDFQLALPRWMDQALMSRIGQKVYFGIRPKSLKPTPVTTEPDDAHAIKGVVDVVESLGDEVLVHVLAGAHHFQVCLDARERPEPDAAITLYPVMSQAHVFDGETELNLTASCAR